MHTALLLGKKVGLNPGVGMSSYAAMKRAEFRIPMVEDASSSIRSNGCSRELVGKHLSGGVVDCEACPLGQRFTARGSKDFLFGVIVEGEGGKDKVCNLCWGWKKKFEKILGDVDQGLQCILVGLKAFGPVLKLVVLSTLGA